MTERKFYTTAAWDKTSSVPSKNYGIHSAELIFVVIGEAGAVSLDIATGWYLPHNRQHEVFDKRAPQYSHLAYHRNADFADHGNTSKCSYTSSGFCVGDRGSSLYAKELAEGLVANGSDWLWTELERLYKERFDAN